MSKVWHARTSSTFFFFFLNHVPSLVFRALLTARAWPIPILHSIHPIRKNYIIIPAVREENERLHDNV